MIELDTDPSSYQERTVMRDYWQSRDQQRRILDRIARLTQLRVLDLDTEERPVSFYDEFDNICAATLGPPTFDTLELRLGAGFGSLSALSRLEVFDFEGMNHRIGDWELAWMATTWPKLRTLHGLQERLFREAALMHVG